MPNQQAFLFSSGLFVSRCLPINLDWYPSVTESSGVQHAMVKIHFAEDYNRVCSIVFFNVKYIDRFTIYGCMHIDAI